MAAIRFLDERVKILKEMATNEQQKGRSRLASRYEKKMNELDNHAGIRRDLIVSGGLAVLEEKDSLESEEISQ
jgi:hypothetical protein